MAKSRPHSFNQRGRPIGEMHPNAKLMDREVDQVFVLREHGLTVREIAAKMDVGFSCIGKILRGERRGQAVARTRRADQGKG